jgi:drug/metabolite transporter (DMT)-like permease
MGFLAVPVVGLASSALLLGEPITVLDFVGATVTFLGIVVISLAPPRLPVVDKLGGPGIIEPEPGALRG